MVAAAADASMGGDTICYTTPFVSAPSSPARDPSFSAVAGGFFSAPTSPARGAVDCDYDELDDFDFSSGFPSPAMASADELFHNGQIRPMRLSSFLLRPQQALLTNLLPAVHHPQPSLLGEVSPANDRGRSRSVVHRRRSRSLSPFRCNWISPSPRAPVKESGETSPPASRSSSSSSTTSSSSSSSRRYRSWRFLKHLVHHRSKSDTPPPSQQVASKRNSSPAPARGHARMTARGLYEARRAEGEETRRRTFLPYRQGLLLHGCLGLGSRGNSLAAAAAKYRS